MGDSDVKSTWRKYWGSKYLRGREQILWEISAVADQKTNDTKGVLMQRKATVWGEKIIFKVFLTIFILSLSVLFSAPIMLIFLLLADYLLSKYFLTVLEKLKENFCQM